MLKKKMWIIGICFILVLTGCSKKEDHTEKSKGFESSGTTVADVAVTAPGVSSSSELNVVEPAAPSKASDGDLSVTFSAADEASTSFETAKETPKMEPYESTPNTVSTQSGQLTAGEWNDNENWDYWNNLLNTQEYSNYMINWQMNTQNRTTVILSSNQQPASGILVTLTDVQGNEIWQSTTDNSGIAYLFSSVNDQGATVELSYKNQILKSFDYESSVEELSFDLGKIDLIDSKTADILFMIDTTGSMSDELSYLQTELKSVITQVAKENTDITINLSSNYYRDQGDEYVISPYPFTRSVDEVTDQLLQQSADGGNDFPEAVDLALSNAIFDHNWSETATAKIIFLVLDAPPHYSNDVIENLHKSIQTAAEMGIKIIPIASSGIDKETEMLLRSFAILTNGTYTFLTDDSGIGNSHLEPTIGTYSVEYLNDLLVRLIKEYTD